MPLRGIKIKQHEAERGVIEDEINSNHYEDSAHTRMCEAQNRKKVLDCDEA